MNLPELPFRLSFSTLGCPDATWDQLCEIGTRFDILLLEIRALENQLDLPAYFKDRFGTPSEWMEVVEAAGVNICGLSTSLRLIGNNSDDREKFLEFIPWAEAVGGVPLRVFDGGSIKDGLPESAAEQALDTIAWWRGMKSRHAWKSDIIIETHNALVRSYNSVQLQSLLDTEVQILWDTHHTWKLGGENPLETWAVLGKWVRHIHVKDSIAQAKGSEKYDYVLPGTGQFPLLTTLQELKYAGFDGVVSLEWEKLWHPEIGGLEDALEAMHRCLHQI